MNFLEWKRRRELLLELCSEALDSEQLARFKDSLSELDAQYFDSVNEIV